MDGTDVEVDTDKKREMLHLMDVMKCVLYMPPVCSVTYSNLWLMKACGTCGHISQSGRGQMTVSIFLL